MDGKITKKPVVLFVYRGDAQKRLLDLMAKGEAAPREFLYGLNYIDTAKYDVRYVIAPRGDKKSLIGILAAIREYPFRKAVKLGLCLDIVPRFKKDFAEADYIFCPIDAISFGILYWKLRGKIKGKVFVLLQSLAERLKYFEHKKRTVQFVSRLLSAAEAVFTLASNAHEVLHSSFDVPTEKLKTLRFGIDDVFWHERKKGSPRGDYILSIGNDMNRDYETLLKALPANVKAIIVTRRKLPSLPNVEYRDKLSDREVEELYHNARAVVIPSTAVTYESSGLSSALQAMACTAPVIMSSCAAIEEQFKNNTDVFFYKAEDSSSLQQALIRVIADPVKAEQVAESGCRLVRSTYIAKKMAEVLERHIG